MGSTSTGFWATVAAALRFPFSKSPASPPVAQPSPLRAPEPPEPVHPARAAPLPLSVPPAPAPSGKPGKKTLVAVVGVSTAAMLLQLVPGYESGRKVETHVVGNQVVSVNKGGNQHLRSYRDMVGVLTICDGDTKDVQVGETDTPEQCQARLERQLIAHAEPVMACVPALRKPEHQQQLAASVSLAYNIGPKGFCHSSVARHFNAGEWTAGCDAFMFWDKAGGREVQGLKRRRSEEREICMGRGVWP